MPRTKMLIATLLTLCFIAGLGVGRFFQMTGALANHDGAKPSPPQAAQQAAPLDAIEVAPGQLDASYVRTAVPETVRAPELVPIAGKLAFNVERTHVAAARVAGRIDRLYAFEGGRVGSGQVLAELYSPEYISAQNEFLLARNTVRTLAGAGGELLEDARSTLAAARDKLRVLGASPAEIERLDRTGAAATHLAVHAPIGGVVAKRNAEPGAYLNLGDSLVTIADSSRLWFYGNIYEQDYARVKLGQELVLTADALPGRQFKARVSFVAPSIDAQTHTLAIRCDVSNADGALRPELFVKALLAVGERRVLRLPKAAVVQVRDSAYVIVQESETRFRRVPVNVSEMNDDTALIAAGLHGDERVLVDGAVLVNELIAKRAGYR